MESTLAREQATTSLGSPRAFERSAAERAPHRGSTKLHETLTRVSNDRASTAERLVLELADALHAYVLERPTTWGWDEAGVELERALTRVLPRQGWRGTVLLFADALRSAWHTGHARHAAGDPAAHARTLLRDELGLWLWGRETGCDDLVEPSGPWNGRPFALGRRMPLRPALARRAVELLQQEDATVENDALRPLERGETILVPGYSETVAHVLVAVQRAGLTPEAIVPEGAPDLAGRRMARRLVQAGVKVRYVYDAQLPALLPRADRVWFGTESIGIEGCTAPVGTSHLLEEAHRREVPALILATTDKLVPGGALELPRSHDAWLLWEDAPEGIRLDPQPIECVAHELTAGLMTEDGYATAASLSLSRLRLETAPPCGASGASASDLPFELR